MTWKSDAPCQGLTTLFFSRDEFDILQAKSLCQSCHLRSACLDRAMSYHLQGDHLLGVWGGMTERERLTILDQSDNRGRPRSGGHGLRLNGGRRTETADPSRP